MMERRALLRWLLSTGGVAAVARLSVRDLEALGLEAHRQVHDSTQALRVLSVAAARSVTVAAELIIPRSETPGATDAQVTPFIDRMLADWYPGPDRDRFVEGLEALDASARTAHGRAFVECSAEEQVAILSRFDAEVDGLHRAGDPNAAGHWFAMLKYLTVWGYCTSEVAMRETLRSYPPPMRYDGDAALAPVAGGRR